MEIKPMDDRIQELCTQALTAEGPELEAVLAELRAALRKHAEQVRFMTLETLSRLPSRD